MNKILPLLLFGMVVFSSCENDPPEVPECIDELASTLNSDFCDGADLNRFDFNGRTVYCFFYGNCTDAKAVIYEDDCTEICTLFGLSGNTSCEGLDWQSNATNRVLIYTF
jgi:hypothetical protein